MNDYSNQMPKLEKVKKELQKTISNTLKSETCVIEKLFRVKGLNSFRKKVKNKKYHSPIHEIEDQIGCRIVVRYRKDVEKVKKKISELFRFRERILKESEQPSTFEYEAYHVVCKIPDDIRERNKIETKFFEIQIMTMFQHAWAETTHDILYKEKIAMDKETKKKLAWLSANAWGADKILMEILDGVTEQSRRRAISERPDSKKKARGRIPV